MYMYIIFIQLFKKCSSLIVTGIEALYNNFRLRNKITPPSDCNAQFRQRIYYFDSPDGGAHVVGVMLHMSERCFWGNYRDEGMRL